MTPAQFIQAVAANVILGIGAAVVFFGAPIVPAIVGGVGAGIVLYLWHIGRGRAPNLPGKE